MRASLLIVLAAAGLIGACKPPVFNDRAQAPLTFDAAVKQLLESPCDSAPVPTWAARVVAGTDHIGNEIHDCQKLLLAPASGFEFGPLVGIYPLHSAMQLTDASAFADTGIAVATIIAWDNSPTPGYPVLGIRDGFSCLWLRVVDHTTWQANIEPAMQSCDRASPPGSGWNLEVDTLVAHTDSIPPTARWGWAHPDQHYIGIRCGNAWCRIGRQGFQPTPEGSTARRRNLQPGWYDEQRIAILQGNALVPGPRAYIYPTDALLALRDADTAVVNAAFAAGIEAAHIEVEGATPAARQPYQDKFNLSLDPGVGTATIWLRMDTANVASYRSSQGELFTKFDHLPDLRHAAPGAVRWRWQSDDETAWVSCKSGCCDVPDL